MTTITYTYDETAVVRKGNTMDDFKHKVVNMIMDEVKHEREAENSLRNYR